MRSGGSRLARFLADARRPAGTLSYHELEGFLFAVASAPDLVRPSEWMPVVFDDRPAAYESVKEAQAVLAELMALYNEINAQVGSGHATLPAGCPFRARTMSNFDADAPVSLWSRGFLRGHSWLEESWADVPDDADGEFALIIMALTFFSSETLARAYAVEVRSCTLDDLASTMRAAFPTALADYARLGRTIHQILMEETARAVPRTMRPKIGRNAPCPCGSGRKYKKCCGAASSPN